MFEELIIGSIIGIYVILLQIMRKLGKLEERVNIMAKILKLNSLFIYDFGSEQQPTKYEGIDFKRFAGNN